MLRSECYSASFWKLARDLNSFAPRRSNLMMIRSLYKFTDCCWSPTASTEAMPSLGVEVGLSESSRQLALSARHWLEASSSVGIVVIIDINRNGLKAFISRLAISRPGISAGCRYRWCCHGDGLTHLVVYVRVQITWYMPLFYAPFSGGVRLFGLAGAHFSSRYKVIYCLAVGNGWPKRFLNSKDGERRVISKLPTSRHESSLSKLSEKEHWNSGNVLEDSMSNPVYIGDPTDTDCRRNWLLIHQEMSWHVTM